MDYETGFRELNAIHPYFRCRTYMQAPNRTSQQADGPNSPTCVTFQYTYLLYTSNVEY